MSSLNNFPKQITLWNFIFNMNGHTSGNEWAALFWGKWRTQFCSAAQRSQCNLAVRQHFHYKPISGMEVPRGYLWNQCAESLLGRAGAIGATRLSQRKMSTSSRMPLLIILVLNLASFSGWIFHTSWSVQVPLQESFPICSFLPVAFKLLLYLMLHAA